MQATFVNLNSESAGELRPQLPTYDARLAFPSGDVISIVLFSQQAFRTAPTTLLVAIGFKCYQAATMRVRHTFQRVTTNQTISPRRQKYTSNSEPNDFIFIDADAMPTFDNYTVAVEGDLDAIAKVRRSSKMFSNGERSYLKSPVPVTAFAIQGYEEASDSSLAFNPEPQFHSSLTRLSAFASPCVDLTEESDCLQDGSKVGNLCDSVESQRQGENATVEAILTPQSVLTPDYSLSPDSPVCLSFSDVCHQPATQDREAKPKVYSPAEWEAIRPKFVKLYCEEDRYLRNVIQTLRDEDNFFATEPMYKRRIKTWKLKKSITAKEKDEAIQALSKGQHPAWQNRKDWTSRVCRIRRHAAFRFKQGKLGRHDHELVIRRSKSTQPYENLNKIEGRQPGVLDIPTESGLVQGCSISNLRPPEDFAYLDQLFPAISALSDLCNSTLPPTIIKEEDLLSYTLDKGLTSWKLNAFDKANEFFSQASHIMCTWLQQNTIPVHTMLYYLLPDAWTGCLPVFSGFVQFTARMVQQELHYNHPLYQAAQLLHENAESPERGLAVWKCMHDHITLFQNTSTQWANIAMYLVRFCKRNANSRLAITFCQEAITILAHADLLTDDLHIDFAIELAENYQRLLDWPRSEGAYLETINLAMTNLDSFVKYKLLALESLAEIEENVHQDLNQAQRLYANALNTAIAFLGKDHPDSLHLMRELLHLCERRRCELAQTMPAEEFLETYHCLEEITSGNWRFRLNSDGSIVHRMVSELCDADECEHDELKNSGEIEYSHPPRMRSFKVMCGPLHMHLGPL